MNNNKSWLHWLGPILFCALVWSLNIIVKDHRQRLETLEKQAGITVEGSPLSRYLSGPQTQPEK